MQHLDKVESWSRSPSNTVAVTALETLAELDWPRIRDTLLTRLETDEEAVVKTIAQIFAARNDPAPVKTLIRLAEREGKTGYDALVVLNAFRMPTTYRSVSEKRNQSYGYTSSPSNRRRTHEINKRADIPVVLDIPPPPGPRILFEKTFGKPHFYYRSGSGGGSASGGGGNVSLLYVIRVKFRGEDIVPILEVNRIRLVTLQYALAFWTKWGAEHKGLKK